MTPFVRLFKFPYSWISKYCFQFGKEWSSLASRLHLLPEYESPLGMQVKPAGLSTPPALAESLSRSPSPFLHIVYTQKAAKANCTKP